MTQKKSGSSGEHPAVAAFRAKAESFDETTLAKIAGLKDRVEQGMTSAPPASAAPVSSTVVVLTIHGTGANRHRLAADIARLAAHLVDELRQAEHTVTFASIAHGGENIVLDQEPLTERKTP